MTYLVTLVEATSDLLKHGDSDAHRLIVWIAFIVHTEARLPPEQETVLARCAGEAAHRSGELSLAALAVPVLDHVLTRAVDGSIAVSFGDLEELNALRQDLTNRVTHIPYL